MKADNCGDVLIHRRNARVSQVELATRLGLRPETITDVEYARIGIDDATAAHWKRIIDKIAKEKEDEAQLANA